LRRAARACEPAQALEIRVSQLAERIQTAVAELSAIQRELNQQLVAAAAHDAASALAEQPEAEAVRDLKCVLDQLRHFLWFYLQAISDDSETSEKTLQLLRQVAKDPARLAKSSSLSFLERLNALSEYALVHYKADARERTN
jgi:hypothetical protein